MVSYTGLIFIYALIFIEYIPEKYVRHHYDG